MPTARVDRTGSRGWRMWPPRLGSAARRARAGVSMLVLVATLLAASLPAHAAAPAARPSAQDRDWQAQPIRKGGLRARDRTLAQDLPDTTRIGYHPGTGRVRLVSGTTRRPLTHAIAAVASGRRALSVADTRDQARQFVARYGGLFGLKAPRRELRVGAVNRLMHPSSGLFSAGAGTVPAARPSTRVGSTVRFEQVRGNIPVLGGEIIVQVSPDGEIVSAVGEVLPSGARVPTRPLLSSARARRLAANWLAREAGRPAPSVRASSEGLALYDPRIMGAPSVKGSGTLLVWQIDARLPATGRQPAQDKLVLVDARSGGIVTSMSRIERVDRFVCDNRNRAGRTYRCRAPYTRTEGQAQVGIADVDAAYRLMGTVADYFGALFGRDGIDGAGSPMKATVRYCPSFGCPWANAEWHWADQQAVFGRGWARADDIVAHEFSHGVLDAEAPFFYQYQSGAINESFADVFGELIDLAYAGGTDTAWTRWKIGEDTPRGVFRDMKDPTRFGHPDRVRSPLWYHGSADDGGVHRNSGVGNKAASLISDGGTFRGYQIEGLGRARTARIYYQALTTRLTAAADYVDLADALVAACADLAGSDNITVGDCKTVRDATLATQMNRLPRVLAPHSAPVCATGRRAVDVFSDDFEDPSAGLWKTARLLGRKRGWYYPPNPNNRPRWDGRWASSGKLNLYAPDRPVRSDTVMRLTKRIKLPPRAYLRFEHGFGFDRDGKRRYDGGIVQIRINGGHWRGVNALFTHGGYNGRIAKRRGNRLAGKRAFTGSSHGWSSSRIDLSKFAGKTVEVRFRMASDRKVGDIGWYVDDVRIYSCQTDEHRPSGTISIADGADQTTDPEVSLAITWADAGAEVTTLRLSNSPALNARGRLVNGLSMPIRASQVWDLTEPAWGGDAGLGSKQVYAQVRDSAGNWSAVFSDAIDLVASS